MGNLCTNSKSGIASKPQVAYYNFQGTLVRHAPQESHDTDAEFEFVTKHDKPSVEAGEECYIVQANWLSAWLKSISEETNVPFTEEISNRNLLDENGLSIRQSEILPKKDFRPVSRAVWEFLFEKYGGGPVIAFRGLFSNHAFTFLISNFARFYISAVQFGFELVC